MTTADPAAPAAGGRSATPPDAVVAEYDLVLCQPDPQAELVLTRFPLVGRDRPTAPYLAPSSARVKPASRKLEMVVPAAGAGGEPDAGAGGVTLGGALADAGGRLALAVRRGGSIYLTPVASTACLTPRVASTAAESGNGRGRGRAAAAADASTDAKPPPPPALTPLTVRVNRRETERQQEARESSYAHLADAEAREPWVGLDVAPPRARAAAAALASLLAAGDAGPPGAAAQLAVPAADYLAVLAPPAPPSDYAEPAPPPAAAASGDASPSAATPLGAPPRRLPAPAPPPSAALAALPPGAADAVRAALAAAWRSTSLVVSLAGVRAALRRAPPPGGDAVAAAAAAAAPDALLRAAADAAGAVCVRGSYVPPTPTGFVSASAASNTPSPTDAAHTVILSLLQSRGSFRKADLAAALAAAGVDAPESAVARLVKGVCRARGNLWALKDD